LADFVAKVGEEQLASKNAQQSNLDEWIFDSTLRADAWSWINLTHSDGQNSFATWGNSGIVPYEGPRNQLSRNVWRHPHVASQRWRAAMVHYIGLDVSLKQTSICVVNQVGSVVREGVVDSPPEAIATFVRSKAPGAVRIGLETGPTATWLWTELKQLGLPVICIDARHAKAVLKM
jgi:hypothetical protein